MYCVANVFFCEKKIPLLCGACESILKFCWRVLLPYCCFFFFKSLLHCFLFLLFSSQQAAAFFLIEFWTHEDTTDHQQRREKKKKRIQSRAKTKGNRTKRRLGNSISYSPFFVLRQREDIPPGRRNMRQQKTMYMYISRWDRGGNKACHQSKKKKYSVNGCCWFFFSKCERKLVRGYRVSCTRDFTL